MVRRLCHETDAARNGPISARRAWRADRRGAVADGHEETTPQNRQTTWAEVLIPLFVFDFFLIVDGFGGLCMPNPTEVDDDGNLPEQITLSDRLKASGQLVIYILFIAFQALLVQKMDGDADSLNWNVVFLPWYLWEAARITWLVQETCFTTIERPAPCIAHRGARVEAQQAESAQHWQPQLQPRRLWRRRHHLGLGRRRCRWGRHRRWDQPAPDALV